MLTRSYRRQASSAQLLLIAIKDRAFVGLSVTESVVARSTLGRWPTWILGTVAAITLTLYVMIFTISPLIGEDFALTRQFGDEGFLGRISWVVSRSLEQSSSWNARLGEQLSIFWLSMPKVVFTLSAVAAFVLLAFLSATSISGSRHLFFKVSVSIALIFALWPGMEVFFWGTANAGYLQPALLLLSCMYFYRNRSSLSRLHTSGLYSTGVSLLAFFGGLSFENAPIAIVSYMAATLFLHGRTLISIRTLAPLVSMALGWVLLLSAPSTARRSQYYKDTLNMDGYSVDYLRERFIDVLTVFISTALPLLVVALISSVYLFVKKKYRMQLALMASTAVLVVGSVLAAPYTEPRAFLLAWAILYAIGLAGVFELVHDHRIRQYALIGVCGLALYFPFYAHATYSGFSILSNTREAHILAEQSKGECDEGIKVDRITDQYPYKYLNNRDSWYAANVEGFVSNYYDCKVSLK